MKLIINVKFSLFILIISSLLSSCKDNDIEKPGDLRHEPRNFEMGFTTWPYDATPDAVDSTYSLIHANGDCYTEHLDNKIPWKAFINNSTLPTEFVNDLAGRKSRKPANKTLILSVSLLNGSRDNLLEGYDGSIPAYNKLNDSTIENAYFNYLDFLLKELQPNYLIAALEVNELLKKDAVKWEEYKLLMAAVKTRIKAKYPNLPVSESITMHNWYAVNSNSVSTQQQEIASFIANQDFAAISFYPFLAGLTNKEEFEKAFEFLNREVAIPIAFSETGHLAEDLIIPNLNTNIQSDPVQQNQYMQCLLNNAQSNNYKFVTWWVYRDYDKLWNTFPPSIKDFGQIWRDTGIEDENGKKRPAYSSWREFYDRQLN